MTIYEVMNLIIQTAVGLIAFLSLIVTIIVITKKK